VGCVPSPPGELRANNFTAQHRAGEFRSQPRAVGLRVLGKQVKLMATGRGQCSGGQKVVEDTAKCAILEGPVTSKVLWGCRIDTVALLQQGAGRPSGRKHQRRPPPPLLPLSKTKKPSHGTTASQHSLKINGKTLEYTATAGICSSRMIPANQGQRLFYRLCQEPSENPLDDQSLLRLKRRPGAASVWLTWGESDPNAPAADDDQPSLRRTNWWTTPLPGWTSPIWSLSIRWAPVSAAAPGEDANSSMGKGRYSMARGIPSALCDKQTLAVTQVHRRRKLRHHRAAGLPVTCKTRWG